MGGPVLPSGVTFAISTHVSTVCTLDSNSLLGLEMPAAWDTADIYVLASSTNNANSVFGPVKDQTGAAFKIVAAANDRIWLDPLLTAGAIYIKLQSGATGSTVDQTAARTLQLICGDR